MYRDAPQAATPDAPPAVAHHMSELAYRQQLDHLALLQRAWLLLLNPSTGMGFEEREEIAYLYRHIFCPCPDCPPCSHR